MGLSDVKVFITILVVEYWITSWLDVVTELVSLDESFDGSYDGKLEVFFPEFLLWSFDSKFIGSDEGNKLGSTDGKVIENILVNVDVIILGLDVVTDLVSLDGYFDVYNYGYLESLFIGYLLGSTYVKVLGFDDVITMMLSYGSVIGTILGNVDVIIVRLNFGTYMGSLDESFDGSNDCKHGGLLIGDSMWSIGGKVVGLNEDM